MSLQTWLWNGWLLPQQAAPDDIADLLEVADQFLADSAAPGLSADGRLYFAYSAALATASAALAALGYRVERESHH